MAIYTITLEDYVHFIWEDDYNQIFPEYELFDEEHKQELQDKIWHHYAIYELGMETYEQWLWQFKTKWLEIIPLANKYFEALSSPLLKQFGNDIRNRVYTLNRGEKTNRGKEVIESDNNRVFQDTPYTKLGTTDYATDKTTDHNKTTREHTVAQQVTQNDKVVETMDGVKDLTFAEAVKKYTDYIFDVDLWIIKQMRDLFMMVY